jgi:hypothetical protein
VYVDPPTSVRTVTSDSAYHEWQRSATPAYQTVPRVVREGQEEAVLAREVVRDVAPGVREVTPSDDWAEDDAAAASKAPVQARVTTIDPWDAMERGDYASARDAFRAIADSSQSDARPWIGSAIATAALGEEAQSAEAFRRALIVEPERFGIPEGREGLVTMLERTSVTLRSLGGAEATSADRWMVIASVDCLRGAYSESREAIKRCRGYGETHLGAKNLWRILGLSDKALEKVVVE